MLAVITLALLHRGGYLSPKQVPISPLWEEEAIEQKISSGYHPKIRFNCWDITRYKRSTTYMFKTPDLIQQGQFQVSNGHYYFHAVMANELENYDRDKLTQDADPATRRKFEEAYAKSMIDFEGEYNDVTKVLRISYPVKGMMKSFSLYATNQGDEAIQSSRLSDGTGVVGLWQAPDPFPERLDAKTRGKIDDRGLMPFFREAGSSDSALFSILDIKADGSYRSGGETGSWSVDGSTLRLSTGVGTIEFQIGPSGLMKGGHVVYMR